MLPGLLPEKTSRLRPAYVFMPKHGRGCRWPGLHACVHRCMSGGDMMAQGLWVRGAHLSVDAVLGLGKVAITQNAGLSARAWRQSPALGGSHSGGRPHCPHCPHCPHWSSMQSLASLGAGAHLLALLSVRFPLGTVPLALAPLPPLLPCNSNSMKNQKRCPGHGQGLYGGRVVEVGWLPEAWRHFF